MKIKQYGQIKKNEYGVTEFVKGDRLEIETYDGIKQYGIFTRFTQSMFGHEQIVLTHMSSPINPERWTSKIKIRDIININVLVGEPNGTI